MPRLSLVPRSDLLIRSALSDFLLACVSTLRSPKTMSFYTERLGHFLTYLEAEGITDPHVLEARHVRAFLAKEAKHDRLGGRPRVTCGERSSARTVREA